MQPTLYSYNVLKVATKDFHHDNKLGQGAFGTVFKVCLLTSCPCTIHNLINVSSNLHLKNKLNEICLNFRIIE